MSVSVNAIEERLHSHTFVNHRLHLQNVNLVKGAVCYVLIIYYNVMFGRVKLNYIT